jgi:hypothetical protein
LPDSTLFYLAGADMYSTIWQPMLEQLEAFSDESGDEMEAFDPLAMAGLLLGIEIEGDLLEDLAGPYAVSVNAEADGSSYAGQFHVYSQLADEVAVRDALADIAASLAAGDAPVEETRAGFRVSDDEITLEASVEDGILHVRGTYGDPAGIGTLSGDAAHRRAIERLPGDATMTGYVAIHRLLDLLPGEAWSQLDDDTRATIDALGPLSWATGPDRDGTRTRVTLYLNE